MEGHKWNAREYQKVWVSVTNPVENFHFKPFVSSSLASDIYLTLWISGVLVSVD